jgi:hypothetical protein
VCPLPYLSSLSLMFLLVTNLPSLPAKGEVLTCTSHTRHTQHRRL